MSNNARIAPWYTQLHYLSPDEHSIVDGITVGRQTALCENLQTRASTTRSRHINDHKKASKCCTMVIGSCSRKQCTFRKRICWYNRITMTMLVPDTQMTVEIGVQVERLVQLCCILGHQHFSFHNSSRWVRWHLEVYNTDDVGYDDVGAYLTARSSCF